MARKGLAGKAILSQDLKTRHPFCAVYTGLQETVLPLSLSLASDVLLCLFYTTDINPCQPLPVMEDTRDKCVVRSRCAANECQISEACPSPVATFLERWASFEAEGDGRGEEVSA